MGGILLVQLTTGSYALAGLVGAVQTITGAVAAPRIGRLADRYGERTILLWGTLAHAGGMIALVITSTWGGNAILMCLSGALIGGSNIPFSSFSRARWTRSLGSGPALERAYSLESMADEAGFVIGPLIVVPLCVSIHPSAGLLVAVGVLIVASAMLYRQSAMPATDEADVRLSPHPTQSASSPIAIPGVRVLATVMFAVGFIFGTVDIVIVAFAEDHGARGMTSVLAALFAFGSFIGAAVYGSIRWRASVFTRLRIGIWWLGLGTIPILIASSMPMMYIAGIFIGLSISPALIATNTVLERIVPTSSLTEAFAWLNSAMATGAAAGGLVCGWVVDEVSLRAGQSIGVLGGALGAAALVIWASHLRPQGKDVEVVGVVE